VGGGGDGSAGMQHCSRESSGLKSGWIVLHDRFEGVGVPGLGVSGSNCSKFLSKQEKDHKKCAVITTEVNIPVPIQSLLIPKIL